MIRLSAYLQAESEFMRVWPHSVRREVHGRSHAEREAGHSKGRGPGRLLFAHFQVAAADVWPVQKCGAVCIQGDLPDGLVREGDGDEVVYF